LKRNTKPTSAASNLTRAQRPARGSKLVKTRLSLDADLVEAAERHLRETGKGTLSELVDRILIRAVKDHFRRLGRMAKLGRYRIEVRKETSASLTNAAAAHGVPVEDVAALILDSVAARPGFITECAKMVSCLGEFTFPGDRSKGAQPAVGKGKGGAE
jgi:hypothetical protein